MSLVGLRVFLGCDSLSSAIETQVSVVYFLAFFAAVLLMLSMKVSRLSLVVLTSTAELVGIDIAYVGIDIA